MGLDRAKSGIPGVITDPGGQKNHVPGFGQTEFTGFDSIK
jgi:hypothetical protein